MAESFEYDIRIERRYPSVLKGAEYSVFREGGAPGAPEELKKVTFLDW